MGEHDAKAMATTLIWLGMGIAAGLTNLGGNPTIYSVMMTAIYCASALVATGYIWRGGAGPKDEGKSKRETAGDARVGLLLKLLDDEDRKTLKTRLINQVQSDGELPGAADLFEVERERY